ncbi:squalene/phytoene synthase family protein [Microbacterium sp. LRZ72]|uniref:phytoene/squalene synthase family protein n=1 Tax=Microbacterium sp. LRZ72 TaxID=2942481 RepID=UPI0029B499EA|nr:squalene/phytoene synthase family protein [Microbacterium sp. LRZ72]MDX2375728.1 squalene/phytoene synthase family protein [Microbacterium sp. LRZ72]
MRRPRDTTGLALYDATARAAAATVISRYSTSFGVASRLLGPRVRPHVHAVYALVRVADEIVDGPAHEAGMPASEQVRELDAFEARTLAAIGSGFSADLIVHAFALTARECGIGEQLIRPFFASMRTDITVAEHDAASHERYVYGSAEVVGLMCLQAFLNAGSARAVAAPPDLAEGARRLGAAFQNVNFLRDAGFDRETLGRDYLALGAHDEATPAEAGRTRAAVLESIDADLAAAAAIIPRLPADSRRAVTAAHDLFAELNARLRRTPPGSGRVRVPDPVKAALLARAAVGATPRAPHPDERSGRTA